MCVGSRLVNLTDSVCLSVSLLPPTHSPSATLERNRTSAGKLLDTEGIRGDGDSQSLTGVEETLIGRVSGICRDSTVCSPQLSELPRKTAHNPLARHNFRVFTGKLKKIQLFPLSRVARFPFCNTI
jgi:hypothetical protein